MDKPNETEKQLKLDDLQPIIDHIEKYYEGNVLIVSEWLDRAIYMFHFIPDDGEFTAMQKRNVCCVILGIKESLVESHFKLNELDYEEFN
jgi:hypothetical protein